MCVEVINGMADTIAKLEEELAELKRHGKWVVAGETTHYYICSNCGEPGDCFDNYCRSCGARMDGGAENANDRRRQTTKTKAVRSME